MNNTHRISSRDNVANMVRVLANQRKGIKICHINAQSLRKKIDEFRLIFENSCVDLICVSETWFDSEITDLSVSLNGYNLRRVDREDGYGGVAMYIRKGISFNIKCTSKDNCDFEDINNTDPLNFVEYLFIEVNNESRKLLVGSVYRPNRNICTRRFIRTLETQTALYDDVIIAGDFNSNLLVDSSFSDECASLGLISPNILLPTHFTATNSTLLDLFLVSNKINILLYDQLSASCFSKHDLIFMTYNFQLVIPVERITFRDFKNINYSFLEDEFFKIDWNVFYCLTSVDDQLSFLEQALNYLFDLTVPIKTKIISNKHKPWFSPEIKDYINQRDLAYARWKRFRTTTLHEDYLAAKRRTNKMIKKAKSDFYAEKFSSAIGSKRTWQTIREVGIGKSTNQEPCLIDADTINEKFLNVPMVQADQNYYINNHSNNNSESFFSFAAVDQCDVLSSLLSIKSNSIGLDGINPKFLKILLPQLLPIITFFFNKILTSSYFPSNWKIAKIVPIPKAGSDYRPIAILPFLSKVFERIMHNQITSFLDNNNLLTDRQSGFRKKHSCITALVDVTEEIREKLDDGETTFLILLDHSKAFDTVDHDILCYKLKNFFNFSSTATQLLSTYLCNRYQFVETSTQKSKALPVARGVPQGSIVGPLLFSLYSNDLPSMLTNCNVRMYADDVQLYTSCSNALIDQCIIFINQQLQRIYTWATANGLGINPKKSKCIVIQKRLSKLNIIPNIFINNQKIEIVKSAKNLGIFFNDTLTWSNHINYACGRTFSMTRTLWQTHHCTPLRIRILLAKTYLMPVLLYGCELFAKCDAASKRKLNVAFNNVIRYVYGLNRRSSVSMFSSQLYGLSLDNLLNVRVLVFLHKIVYTHKPDHLYGKLNISDISRGKRIKTFRYKSLISEWHFYIFAVSLWNSIPHSSQLLSNARKFKENIFKLFSA